MTSNLSYFQDLLTSIISHGAKIPIPGMDKWEAKTTNLVKLAKLTVETRGEASAIVHAEQLLQQYEEATAEECQGFFHALLNDFDLDSVELARLAAAYHEDRSPENYALLSKASEPRRQELFRRLNAAPRGTVRLVRMRADLLKLMCEQPELRPVDIDLKHLLRSWFNRGFLVMRPIDWNTPANILEKIIAYEAVHEICSWSELRLRLEPTDRRCFAFFHPAMQDEPLIFVEVALTGEISNSIQTVLSPSRDQLDAEKANTAVFYSISNCQTGLAGISFGSFLIKQVAHKLKNELPELKNFVTLSPVPGLMKWVKQAAEATGNMEADDEKFAPALALLNDESWPDNEEKSAQLAALLPSLAAEYLLSAKIPNGKPLDPVARFHLGNGAQLEQINFRANLSFKGLENAGSIMVNYLYDLTKTEQNHEAFAENHQVFSSKAVTRLLKDKTANFSPFDFVKSTGQGKQES